MRARWLDFGRSFVYTPTTWNRKGTTLSRYKVTKPRYNNILFKNFIVFFFNVIQRHSLRSIHDIEPFKFAYSCAHSEHERMCVVITKEYLCRGNLNKYIYLLGLLDSPFKLLKTSIKGHVRKNCFGTIVYQCASKAKLAWMETSLCQMV